MTGTVLADRYVLGAVLGRGGMGLVLKAVDLKLSRDVAVKLLSSPSPSADSLRRFSREALAAGSLQHANVVQVFDAGEQQGRPFLVTELLQGETLQQRLSRGPLPLEQAVMFAKQLIAGLAAAHEKGLIHRDLKPSNIFVTDGGWLKILDFGLAKLTDALPLPEASDSQRTAGTIGYMAPEQVRGQPVDARTDLFNFGLVLYEMLSGGRAFSDVSPTETSYAIVVREPSPLPKTVPPRLRKIVEQCLRKDREQRPGSASAVEGMLHAPEQPRRAWKWAAAASVALLLLAGALLWKTRSAAGPPPSGSVAIMPFDASEAPGQEIYGLGISLLLAEDLRDAALRPLQAQTVVDGVSRAGAGNVTKARAASVSFGANYFVVGRVRAKDGALHVSAELYDAASEAPVVAAEARGKPQEIYRLVRTLSDQLQKQRPSPAEFDARLASLQRRLTPSLPALQAWLESESLRRDGKWEPHLESIRRAVKLDPDFAAAQFTAGIDTLHRWPDEARASLRQALRSGDRLSFLARIDAESVALQLDGDVAGAERVLVAATREHPENGRAWALLAYYREFHETILGQPPFLAAADYQRSLEMEPLNITAAKSLMDLAQIRGEREVVSRMADRLFNLADDPLNRADVRLARAWARGDVAEHDEVMKELRAPGMEITAISTGLARTLLQRDGSPDAESLASLLPFIPGAQFYRATASLFHGHVKAARQIMTKAAAAFPEGLHDFYLPWLDSFEFYQPADLARSRADAARLDVTKRPHLLPAKHYLVGLLALRANDLKGATSAAEALAATPELPNSTIAADLTLALRARILFARGDAAAALQTLDQRKLHSPEGLMALYNTGRENFLRGSLLVALGRPREAIVPYQALYSFPNHNPLYAPAELALARIYDSLGEKSDAIFHYTRFTEIWGDCDPELRPEVARAQARLAELRRD